MSVEPITEKQCSHCKITKPIDRFSGSNRYASGYRSDCKDCCADQHQRWRKKNPIRYKERITLWKYGINMQEYNRLFQIQGGMCAICKKHQSELKMALGVDHNHSCCPGSRSCGKCVRGLLCQNCNVALGFMGDNLERIDSMRQYLVRYKEGE